MASNKTIIITMGDPSGIGPEIILKALSSRRIDKCIKFIVVGDRLVFKKVSKCQTCLPAGQGVRVSKRVEFVDLNNVDIKSFSFGKVKAEYGRAALEYIDKALEIMRKENIKALVTAPVSKKAISLVDRGFSGQTEYLAKKSHTRHFAMLLANDKLRIALVSRHIPLKDVAKQISIKTIFQTVKLTHRFLKDFYLIRKPNLALCALNPHSGDRGILGKEENTKIIPAINKVKKSVRCAGPYPADYIFAAGGALKFDAIVAMYHDQALIPLKITGRETGVNITIGLPFIRTSPLHGVAFDIAGENKASPLSMISAINAACTFLRNAS